MKMYVDELREIACELQKLKAAEAELREITRELQNLEATDDEVGCFCNQLGKYLEDAIAMGKDIDIFKGQG